MRCGLLGGKLGHSYSPAIHGMLAEYSYRLYEKAPDEVEQFVRSGEWDGLNVTIPYKKTVLPLCAELSKRARNIGAVNTLVRRPDGSIFGDNTDACGFEKLIARAGIEVQGKKTLVLGSGGASVMAVEVLRSLGASPVVVISRHGEDNYGNLSRHSDAKILVNTTPVGMYPNNGEAAVDLDAFPACEGVLDVVYNPARTALLLQAERRGIPHAGGLYMLIAQAKRSCELFTGREIPDSELDRIEAILSRSMQNVVLIGMPGCGKSTIGALLAEKLGRPLLEADAEIEKAAGCSIPDIFAAGGEASFRQKETVILGDLGKRSGAVISTGGGCVTREENYDLLHQNGVIFWLHRDLDVLPKEGRPLSLTNDLRDMFAVRRPLYERFADHVIDNNGTPEETLRQILEVLG